MKRLIQLSLSLTVFFVVTNAQTVNPLSPSHSIDQEPIPITNSVNKTYRCYTEWLNPVQNWKDQGALFKAITLTQLYPDSFVVIINTDSSLSYHNTHLLGTVFQPTEPFYELQSGWLMNDYDLYAVDSIRFPYAYLRYTDSMNIEGKMANIVDTAIIHFYKYEQLDDWYMSATDDRFAIPIGENFSVELLGPTDVLFTDTILLTKELATDTTDVKTLTLDTFQFAIPDGIKDIGDNSSGIYENVVGVSVVYKPMQHYTKGDTLFSNINNIQPTKKLNNFGIASYNNDSTGLPQKRFFNNSFVSDKRVRYGQDSLGLRGYLPSMEFIGFEPDIFFNFDFLITAIDMNVDTIGNIGMDEASSTLRVKVYPNPSSTLRGINIKIEENVTLENISITLSDLLGNVISDEFTTVGPKEFSIATDKLAGGVYLVTVKTEEKSSTARIILSN